MLKFETSLQLSNVFCFKSCELKLATISNLKPTELTIHIKYLVEQ